MSVEVVKVEITKEVLELNPCLIGKYEIGEIVEFRGRWLYDPRNN